MMYGDTAHDGSVYWLTRGAAQIPAWRNTFAMALAFPEIILYGIALHLFYIWYKKHDAGLSVPDWFYKWSDKREHDYLVRDHAGVESMQETGRRKMKGKECGFETEKIGRGLP